MGSFMQLQVQDQKFIFFCFYYQGNFSQIE